MVVSNRRKKIITKNDNDKELVGSGYSESIKLVRATPRPSKPQTPIQTPKSTENKFKKFINFKF